ncbi:MAG TPA: glycosyltransferase family 8 protein [Pirellulaceae bacterium]|nr:glycosyltransferase family 8 protein [Pirellulaceae bacterium]
MDSPDPVVLCTTDERYAMPLAVTLSSAAEQLPVGRSMCVYLVDAGLSSESRHQLHASLAPHPVELNFVPADAAELGGLSISHHISHTAYLRLLADRWLPSDLQRVIYLDSDLLVRDSLTELWSAELGDHAVLAVPDIACPFVNARFGCRNYRKASPYLACLSPVQNHRQLGLAADSLYFNSGVMVMNLDRWRRERLGEQMLECLRANREHIWCWDQYALNVVLAGRWGRLPLRWNVGTHAFEYPSLACAPLEQAEFAESLQRPAVFHFTTEFKPWLYRSNHPLREQFFAALDQTAWRGWRPEKPHFNLSRWWQRQAVRIAKRWTISYRKLAAWRVPEPI